MSTEVDPAELRRRTRRTGLLLLGFVLLLALLTVAYVRFYDRVLRDPDSPPSVKGMNPRVLVFEISLWVAAVLALGITLNHFLRKRR